MVLTTKHNSYILIITGNDIYKISKYRLTCLDRLKANLTRMYIQGILFSDYDERGDIFSLTCSILRDESLRGRVGGCTRPYVSCSCLECSPPPPPTSRICSLWPRDQSSALIQLDLLFSVGQGWGEGKGRGRGRRGEGEGGEGKEMRGRQANLLSSPSTSIASP
jgi:hypothetical protein